MKKLKLLASYVCLITCLLLHRNFGKNISATTDFFSLCDECISISLF